MNRNELLRRAAELSGINYHHIDHAGVWWRQSHMATQVYCWNPLENLEHAKAFAEKCGAQYFRFDPGTGEACAKIGPGQEVVVDARHHRLGSDAAMCMAIVCSAVGVTPISHEVFEECDRSSPMIRPR